MLIMTGGEPEIKVNFYEFIDIFAVKYLIVTHIHYIAVISRAQFFVSLLCFHNY